MFCYKRLHSKETRHTRDQTPRPTSHAHSPCFSTLGHVPKVKFSLAGGNSFPAFSPSCYCKIHLSRTASSPSRQENLQHLQVSQLPRPALRRPDLPEAPFDLPGAGVPLASAGGGLGVSIPGPPPTHICFPPEHPGVFLARPRQGKVTPWFAKLLRERRTSSLASWMTNATPSFKKNRTNHKPKLKTTKKNPKTKKSHKTHHKHTHKKIPKAQQTQPKPHFYY